MRTGDMDQEFALMGAEVRVQQLKAEIEDIYRRFPDLRRRSRRPTAVGRPKRQFSSKGKKAISEGMRKYWARRKAQQSKAGKTAKAG